MDLLLLKVLHGRGIFYKFLYKTSENTYKTKKMFSLMDKSFSKLKPKVYTYNNEDIEYLAHRTKEHIKDIIPIILES